tara:strand:- start:3072 stop:3584 length:513 start_codon:yes stop_codon:yes gene_type:complete
MSQTIASFEGRRNPDFRTPKSFIEWLEDRNGRPFTLDVAASKENAICDNYFDQQSNGLLNSWSGQVWCNPPYGRAIADWLNKCAIEITRKEVDSIWVLIPARTDTKWFHELVMPHAYLVYLIKGRINFSHDTSIEGKNAPFPSMLIVYRKHKLPDAGITVLDVPKEARSD